MESVSADVDNFLTLNLLLTPEEVVHVALQGHGGQAGEGEQQQDGPHGAGGAGGGGGGGGGQGGGQEVNGGKRDLYIPGDGVQISLLFGELSLSVVCTQYH